MSDALFRLHKTIGDITTAAFEDGRRQEREAIIEKLDAIKGEVGRDLENQILELINQLREEKK